MEEHTKSPLAAAYPVTDKKTRDNTIWRHGAAWILASLELGYILEKAEPASATVVVS